MPTQESDLHACFRLYSTLLIPVRGHVVISTLLIPAQGHGVISTLLISVQGHGVISTLLIPVWCHGVCSLINGETLLEVRSELRSDALLATTIDFSGIRTHDSLCANPVF